MRLQQLQSRIASVSQVQGSTAEEVRESIRAVFERSPDAPISVARGIETLIDDLMYSHLPGVTQAIVQIIERATREAAASILYLVNEKFSEAAWFRTDTALSLMESYLDALTLYEQLQTIDG